MALIGVLLFQQLSHSVLEIVNMLVSPFFLCWGLAVFSWRNAARLNLSLAEAEQKSKDLTFHLEKRHQLLKQIREELGPTTEEFAVTLSQMKDSVNEILTHVNQIVEHLWLIQIEKHLYRIEVEKHLHIV